MDQDPDFRLQIRILSWSGLMKKFWSESLQKYPDHNNLEMSHFQQAVPGKLIINVADDLLEAVRVVDGVPKSRCVHHR